MPIENIILGPVMRDATRDGGALAEVISNPFASLWVFPNYHDKGQRQQGVQMMPDGEVFSEDCNTALLALDDPRRNDFKCLRNLARPRTSGPGLYRANFGMDRAGNFSLSVTFKVLADPLPRPCWPAACACCSASFAALFPVPQQH